ncbi:MAG: patatin-like phospholipase family protein [Rhizobiaceae bacterium]
MPVDKPKLSAIDGDKLEDGTGLCISGGGYRAMLFHAGAIFRMNELGLIKPLKRVSSVSGGSMTAAALAVAWPKLTFDAKGVATNLKDLFLKPLIAQSEDSIDVGSALVGILPLVTAADMAAKSYDKHIAKNVKLASLPTKPLFVFNATNLMTGAVMRFRPDYIADHHIGVIKGVDLKLSRAIACSAAFPPFLSPSDVDLSDGTIAAADKGHLARAPFTQKAVLTDGGVYDNMGTETVWKRLRTVFVSNAGKPFGYDETPARDWLQQSLRVIDILMDQSENLRERILADAYRSGARTGAMWGLTTGLNHPEDMPKMLTKAEYVAAQEVPTRLSKMTRAQQNLILKAGYAHAASRIRKYFTPDKGGPADRPDGAPPSV